MREAEFSDAALVVFGHGSTLNGESGAPVFQHVAELRRRNCFREVHAAFWKQEPRVTELVASLTAPRVFLVPLFISEGYFSDEVIPKALGFGGSSESRFGRVRQNGAQSLVYCPPVGTHPAMTAVLRARAAEVVEKFPFPRGPKTSDITLFIAGHGTQQNEQSRVAIEQQVERLRAANLYAGVHGLFLEEEPRIDACYRLAQTRNIVVVPFFISEGMHVAEDIPVLLGQPARVVQQRLENRQPTWRNPTEREGRLVWCASCAGTDPRMAEVILERVRDAARPLSEAFSG